MAFNFATKVPQNQTMFNFTTVPPLSLYIHIPWCVRKCPYCDFNSHQLRGVIPVQKYIEALLVDLEQDLPKVHGRTVHSIFIGGGTPSLLAAKMIEYLLLEIRTRIPIAPEAEITLEANPGTKNHLHEFKQAGINRLSLGIQSFDTESLQRLGRIHGSNEAKDAIKAARQAGFMNVNLDLMFGLPMQTIEAALLDLSTAIVYQPTHLSWYQLTIEPNTLFHQQPPLLPNDDLIWEIQIAGQEYLQTQGYVQYEVSAYAKPQRQCHHNLNYWKFGDYLGIGAGAHGKISDVKRGIITRLVKQTSPDIYLQYTVKTYSSTCLRVKDVILEFMLNALRLLEGFTGAEFEENTGLAFACIDEPLQQAYALGWLTKSEETAIQRIYPTEIGMQYLNDLLELFDL